MQVIGKKLERQVSKILNKVAGSATNLDEYFNGLSPREKAIRAFLINTKQLK